MQPETEASATTTQTGVVTSPPTPEAPRKRRGPKLNTLAQGRDFLARVIRQLHAGTIEPKRANSIIYALGTWADLQVLVQAEGRMAAIEESIARAAAVASYSTSSTVRSIE